MIKGLSDRRRMPRAGKIKLGVQVASGRLDERTGKPITYPKATDYFVCPPEVIAKYGERPVALPIMFASDDIATVFPQDYKMYRQSGLFCRGDGERAHRWNDEGNLVELACPCPFLESGECGPNATLNFFLPDVPGFGVWQIITGSQRSIVSLNSSLENFSRVFGDLCGVRLILRLTPETTQRFDESRGSMIRQVVHVLQLDSEQSIAELIEMRARRALPPAQVADVLPPVAEPETTAPDDAQPASLTAADAPADEHEQQREVLWTLCLDAKQQKPKLALAFARSTAKRLFKRDIEGLSDLSCEEVLRMTRDLSDSAK